MSQSHGHTRVVKVKSFHPDSFLAHARYITFRCYPHNLPRLPAQQPQPQPQLKTQPNRARSKAAAGRRAVSVGRPGSANNPVVLEGTPTPERPATRSTTTAQKTATTKPRDAQGRFTKLEGPLEPRIRRIKIVKSHLRPKVEKKVRPAKTECVICAATKSTKRSFKASHVEGTCEHFENVCDRCIQMQVKTRIEARQLTEASLPCMFSECETVLDHSTLKKVLTKGLFET